MQLAQAPLKVIPKLPANKGKRNGSCNRMACLTPLAGQENWFNHGTSAWYCRACAMKINTANRREAKQFFNHDMCTPEGRPQPA